MAEWRLALESDEVKAVLETYKGALTLRFAEIVACAKAAPEKGTGPKGKAPGKAKGAAPKVCASAPRDSPPCPGCRRCLPGPGLALRPATIAYSVAGKTDPDLLQLMPLCAGQRQGEQEGRGRGSGARRAERGGEGL